MTDDQILQIASRHSAYADCTPTLRGDAILAFAREVLLLEQQQRMQAAFELMQTQLRFIGYPAQGETLNV